MIKTMEKILEGAADLIRQHRPRAALALLCQDAELLCDHGMAWQIRGLLHFELAEYRLALNAFEQASLLIPLDPQAQCQLAECYLRSRKRDVARVIYVYLAGLEMLPEETVVPVARGLASTDELGASLNFCLVQLRRFRANHELHSIAATVMQRLGCNPDDIHPFVFQAHHLRPDILPYRIAYAQHLLAMQRTREAAATLAFIDLGRIECVASLERLRMLFEQVENEKGAETCKAKLEQIHYQRSSTWRPSNDES